ncbi:hypothetical protein niasHT_016412 [Heterodera trifolii]|uniref:DNA-directed DNA polymerase n=1 Tax=Heterodera trifolii TaxID=157864 RepID=A0ABD2LJ17_9BILA
MYMIPCRRQPNPRLCASDVYQVPKRVVLGLVSNESYVGTIGTSPFNFQPFDVRDISICANGRNYPQAPYSLDFPNGRFARAYHDMHEAIGYAGTVEGNGISVKRYAEGGQCFFVFNLTPSAESSADTFDLIRKGTTAIRISFNTPVPARGIVLIAMAEIDSLLMLDKNHCSFYIRFIEKLLLNKMFIDIHSLDTDDDDYEIDFTTVTITPTTLLEFKEYMIRLASASSPSPTTTSISRSSLSTILGQSTTTVKPTIQLLYSDSLDSTYGGGSSSTRIGEFIISLCSSVAGSEEGGCGGSHVWVWTRVFCCIVILLTLLCGILYAIRSIFILKTKINHQTKDQVTNSTKLGTTTTAIITEMNNVQIERMLSTCQTTRECFRGCFPVDRIPKMIELQQRHRPFPASLIINTDEARQEGSAIKPGVLLRVIFGHCIQSSLDEAQRRGIEPSRLGATITSQLLDPDIWIPIRQITPNTVDTILNRFLDVAQSKSREGSLWGAPFSVIVTTLDTVNLPQRDTISGRGSEHRTLKGARLIIKDKNLLRIRNNNNSYCLFYALEISRIYHCNGMTKQNFSNYINKMHSQQQQDAERLMLDAGIPLNQERYDAEMWVPRVVDHWNAMYPERKFKVFIFGTTGQYRPKYKYGPNEFRTPISLYYNNDHFDGIRCGVGTAIFGRDNYCFACELPFKNADTHKSSCALHCKECGRIGAGRPCRDDGFKTCGAYHNRERGCFIRQLKPRRPKTYRLVVYDCETTQNSHVIGAPEAQQRRVHIVNFVSAFVTCTKCIQIGAWRNSLLNAVPSCEICGPYRTLTFSHRPFTGTEVDCQHVCDDPMSAFTDWLILGLHNNIDENNNNNDKIKQHTKYPINVFAHFGGRFDNVILFRQFFIKGLCPKMIRRGNKLYEMKVLRGKDNPEIKVRDSLNLMPVPLGALPGAFGLRVQDKEFFPHLANVEDNYDRVLPSLPPREQYLYGGMIPERQHRFNEWYAAHQQEPFNLCEQLASYCVNDSRILIEALVAFRTEFLMVTNPDEQHRLTKDEREVEEEEEEDAGGIELGDNGNGGIDITWDTLTIASASMKHFRLNHLRSDQLAIVPESGYDTANNQSLLALKFMEWYAEENGLQIQTAHSSGGEHRIGRYTVDGYIHETDSVIEVNGCCWHAHDHQRHRFKADTVMPSGKTAARIREDDARRMAFIRSQIHGNVKALRNGYRCTAYYRSIEWTQEQWSERVFRGYVAEFMTMKTHASGFPEEVGNVEEEREKFITECEERFGMVIDPALNSTWCFGMIQHYSMTCVIMGSDRNIERFSQFSIREKGFCSLCGQTSTRERVIQSITVLVHGSEQFVITQP